MVVKNGDSNDIQIFGNNDVIQQLVCCQIFVQVIGMEGYGLKIIV